MKELKHVLTYEQFDSSTIEQEQTIDEEFKFGDVKDAVKQIGKKVSTVLIGWDKPEFVAWAKRMAPSYIQAKKITKDLYEKAREAKFDVSNEIVEEFLKEMSKIKGELTSSKV
jgi:hypothetical protein